MLGLQRLRHLFTIQRKVLSRNRILKFPGSVSLSTVLKLISRHFVYLHTSMRKVLLKELFRQLRLMDLLVFLRIIFPKSLSYTLSLMVEMTLSRKVFRDLSTHQQRMVLIFTTMSAMTQVLQNNIKQFPESVWTLGSFYCS